ncbi:type VII secretion-associated protein [Mycobacterium sp. B14F4]|uniref:type VII secretion-associated protein n=1 Tax=Mycobacterium sp. B14F4 TaxID=3153565 RepID=UPI00325D066E
MSAAVVEVGPAAVRGPQRAPDDLVGAAIEYIDDGLGLLGERPVSVEVLWTGVMRAAVGRDADAVVLVCPTWWPASRIERVRTAARRLVPDVADVEVLRRGPLLGQNASRHGTVVVEIAAELIVVTGDGPGAVVPILGDTGAVAAKVQAAVGVSTAVLIDAPAGVDGAAALGRAIADRLRPDGVAVTWADEAAVRRAASSSVSEAIATDERGCSVGHLRRASALAGVVAAVAVCAGFALRGGAEQEGASRLLVEGRIAVVVPAGWPVHRVTTGPGSARLQLDSPSDGDVALHLTQSVGGAQGDLVTTGESLRAALAGESDDVFVGFEASGVRAGRPAVTYREVRRNRHVAWTVLVDGSVRIAIGCQSPPAREDLVRDVCDQAVGSAHATP